MRAQRLIGTVAALAATSVLVACGSDDTESTGTEGEGGGESSASFPITIEHAYGETVIEEQPERVASVAWMNHEVPLALGMVPVGMSKATWGDDDQDGVLPWVEEKLEELDAETPVLFDETEGIDFEAVADTAPDVILASYSGLTEDEYDTLSEIAPTVAFPEIAWATSVQDMVLMNSEALGMAEEGEQLVADLDQQIADSFAEHPSLEGKSVVFSYIDPNDLSQVGFYTTLDTRPAFMAEAGMTMPDAVVEASEGSEEFYATVSAEQADAFADADVFVTYGDPEGAFVAELQDDPLLSQIPAIESGAIAVLEDSTPLAAAANPTPLSIPWGLGEYFDVLAEAADKAPQS